MWYVISSVLCFLSYAYILLCLQDHAIFFSWFCLLHHSSVHNNNPVMLMYVMYDVCNLFPPYHSPFIILISDSKCPACSKCLTCPVHPSIHVLACSVLALLKCIQRGPFSCISSQYDLFIYLLYQSSWFSPSFSKCILSWFRFQSFHVSLCIVHVCYWMQYQDM